MKLTTLVNKLLNRLTTEGPDIIDVSVIRDIVILYDYQGVELSSITFDLTKLPLVDEVVPLYMAWRVSSFEPYVNDPNTKHRNLTDVPVIDYIAATHTGYTLSIVLNHIAEIYNMTEDYYNKTQMVEDYIRALKALNKNLPDELMLWLELNY
jgi:hypothetical protein